MNIRKIVVQLEEVHKEMGKTVCPPARKVTVAAVVENPCAGQYVEDLDALKNLGRDMGGMLAQRGVEALGVAPDDIDSYGKGAIVGTAGEIEHAAAVLHPRFGAPVRAAVGRGADIIPSTKKVGAPGSTIVVPITNKNSIWEFDDMDSAEITLADAPRANEIVIVLALAIGGRPLHRTRPDN